MEGRRDKVGAMKQKHHYECLECHAKEYVLLDCRTVTI